MAFATTTTHRSEARINITPLVDVMLVLLVIFMVAAPVLSRAIPLQLPQAAPPDVDRTPPPEPMRLRIDAAGALTLDGDAVSPSALPSLFAAQGRLAPAAQPMLQIDADGDSDYQAVARVLAAANGAGLRRVGFVHRE
ncbi:MAG TPA: biopolymer transporter ExbD [Luteimonas sp.]|nr:biopolymer transporter ExbD [Luteimonas sp.]